MKREINRENIIRDAMISEDGKYRYWLSRRWGDGKCLGVIMLNPSTADAEVDDPTIKKLIGFAQINGYDAIDVVNLFAWRSTDPRELRTCSDPVGRLNNGHIYAMLVTCDTVLLAWGSKDYPDRVNQVKNLIIRALNSGKLSNAEDIVCLKYTNYRQPSHPLYIGYETPFTPYDLDFIKEKL